MSSWWFSGGIPITWNDLTSVIRHLVTKDPIYVNNLGSVEWRSDTTVVIYTCSADMSRIRTHIDTLSRSPLCSNGAEALNRLRHAFLWLSVIVNTRNRVYDGVSATGEPYGVDDLATLVSTVIDSIVVSEDIYLLLSMCMLSMYRDTHDRDVPLKFLPILGAPPVDVKWTDIREVKPECALNLDNLVRVGGSATDQVDEIIAVKNAFNGIVAELEKVKKSVHGLSSDCGYYLFRIFHTRKPSPGIVDFSTFSNVVWDPTFARGLSSFKETEGTILPLKFIPSEAKAAGVTSAYGVLYPG